ncbi:MAG TPA: outer membrane protein assembly factor BamC [Pseudomonadales bacterium]|nr:outer membrane protein assembly factor BamC [Pseudomonadales bacterium]
MLIKKTVSSVTVSLLAFSVSGCGLFFGDDGVFRDRGDDYLKARSVEPIKIPSDSKGERIGQLFVIPEAGNVSGHSTAEFRVPKPASPETLTQKVDQIKIQKLGEQRWISVSRPPEAVWPSVRNFLSTKGIAVLDQNPSAGVLEATSTEDRYRIQLQNGLSPRSTEIQVVQMSAQTSATQYSQEWPERSANAEREAWMIKELATYLASNTSSQASMLAQGIGNRAARVSLAQSPEPALLMHVDYGRAWASVSGSLNSDGYRVDSANREQGQWLISVSTAVDDDKKETVNYRVQLQRMSDEKVQVTVRNGSGEALPEDESDALLRHIWDNLL